MQINKTTGGVFLITGTTAGAGMLALPIVSSNLGAIYSSMIMMVFWVISLLSAFITIDIILKYEKIQTIPTITGKVLGRASKLFVSLTLLILLYAVLSAYISGISSIIYSIFEQNINRLFIAIICVFIIGLIIIFNILAVDYWNRFLLTLKFILFMAVVFLCLPHIKMEYITTTHNFSNISEIFLILFTSFGFHGSIPTVINYVGRDVKTLRKVFFIGSIIPLLAYICWQIVTVGTLPFEGTDNSFSHVINNNSDLGVFVTDLSNIVHSDSLKKLLDLFTIVALFTSILCVSVGLFDYIKESLNLTNKLSDRLKSIILTFIVPLIFALFYPSGFIFALNFAAIALAILSIIIPTLIALKINLKKNTTIIYMLSYRKYLYCMLMIGVGVILLHSFS